MEQDAEILMRFARTGDETAFSELVRRHVDMVYAAALRLTDGRTGLAADVAQSVFSDLALKAKGLAPEVVLVGWLHRATRLAAAAALRAEARRVAREKEAHMIQEINRGSEPEWQRIRPALDGALDELKEPEREVLLLRFFSRHSFREVGAALGIGENAARMRADRALEKLRSILAGRGIPSTAAALGLILEQNAVATAPPALAAALSSAALATAATHAAVTATATLTVLTMSTAKTVSVAAIVAAGLLVPIVIQQRALTRLRDENARLHQLADSRADSTASAPVAAGTDADSMKLEIARLRAEAAAKRNLEKELAATRAKLANSEKRAATESQAAADVATDLDKAKEDMKQSAIAKMSFTRDWGMAIMIYADKNGGMLPQRLSDVAAPAEGAGQTGNGKLSIDDYELAIRGSLKDVSNPQSMILLREREPWKNPLSGSLNQTFLFVDGHSEVHSAPDAEAMLAWQRQHLPAETQGAP